MHYNYSFKIWHKASVCWLSIQSNPFLNLVNLDYSCIAVTTTFEQHPPLNSGHIYFMQMINKALASIQPSNYSNCLACGPIADNSHVFVISLFKQLYIYIIHLQDQYTPLYAASARGFSEVVKHLIAANADVNCICKMSCYSYIIILYAYVAGNHALGSYNNAFIVILLRYIIVVQHAS